AAMLYLYLKEGKTRMDYTISTNADSFTLCIARGKNKLYQIQITLPKTLKKIDRELPQRAKDIIDKMMFHTTYGFVDVGNPHIVFFVEVEGAFELDKLAENYGYALEQAIDPENGINVSFACQDERDDEWVHLRTWERGAGLTRACGSASLAAAFLYHKKHSLPCISVIHPEGTLTIDLEEKVMVSDTEHEFRGQTTLWL
ncbi:MAG: hypothetical protein ACR2N8_02395, partial [Parvibaculales bacterium]